MHAYARYDDDEDLRTHLVHVHEVDPLLAVRIGHNGLVVLHVGAHESADHNQPTTKGYQ